MRELSRSQSELHPIPIFKSRMPWDAILNPIYERFNQSSDGGDSPILVSIRLSSRQLFEAIQSTCSVEQPEPTYVVSSQVFEDERPVTPVDLHPMARAEVGVRAHRDSNRRATG